MHGRRLMISVRASSPSGRLGHVSPKRGKSRIRALEVINRRFTTYCHIAPDAAVCGLSCAYLSGRITWWWPVLLGAFWSPGVGLANWLSAGGGGGGAAAPLGVFLVTTYSWGEVVAFC